MGELAIKTKQWLANPGMKLEIEAIAIQLQDRKHMTYDEVVHFRNALWEQRVPEAA